jgi:hypothetical protein
VFACALLFQFQSQKIGAMDAKNVIFGETGLDKLVQALRASGQPQDIAKLVERYLEILRELVLAEEKR